MSPAQAGPCSRSRQKPALPFARLTGSWPPWRSCHLHRAALSAPCVRASFGTPACCPPTWVLRAVSCVRRPVRVAWCNACLLPTLVGPPPSWMPLRHAASWCVFPCVGMSVCPSHVVYVRLTPCDAAAAQRRGVSARRLSRRLQKPVPCAPAPGRRPLSLRRSLGPGCSHSSRLLRGSSRIDHAGEKDTYGRFVVSSRSSTLATGGACLAAASPSSSGAQGAFPPAQTVSLVSPEERAATLTRRSTRGNAERETDA